MAGKQSEKLIEPPIAFTTPSPATLLHYLKITLGRIEKLPPQQAEYCQVVNLVRSLPIPRIDDDSFWDKVSQDEIAEILKPMINLYEKYICISQSRLNGYYADYKDSMLLHISIFSICDKLSRKLPELHLDNFHFHLSIKDYIQPHHFQLGKDNIRFEAIKEYMEAVNSRYQHIIFVIQHAEYKEISVDDLIKDKPDEYTLQHLKFVSQFVPLKLGKCSTADFFEQVIEFTNDANNKLPAQIYRLRMLAQEVRTILAVATVFRYYSRSERLHKSDYYVS